MVVLAALHKELVASAFDPAGSAALGYPVRRLDMLVLAAVTVTMATTIPATGTLLSVALLTVPALTARLWTDRVGSMMAVAAAVGAASGLLGLAASTLWRIAAGGAIGLAAAALFGLSLAVTALRSAAGYDAGRSGPPPATASGVGRSVRSGDAQWRPSTYRCRVYAFRPPWARPPWAGHGRRRGVALGIVVAVAQVGATYLASRHQPDAQPMDAFAYVLLAGSGLALIARRRHPVLVLAGVAAAVVTYHALAYANGPFFLSLVIALIGAVLGGHRRAAWITAGAAFAGFFVLAGLVGRQDVPVLGQAAAIGAWLLLILVVAEFARTRRDQAVEAFHAPRRGGAAAGQRGAAARGARAARRAGPQHLADQRPGRRGPPPDGRAARAGPQRVDGDQAGQQGRPGRAALGARRAAPARRRRAPRPGAHPRPASTPWSSRPAPPASTCTSPWRASARPLPSPVDLAAFRIVQEALTNVTKHAGPAAATVQLRYGDDRLVVAVDDDGPRAGAPAPAPAMAGTGSGLAGMRERAAALGGELVAGPRTGGGFHVVATLPLGTESVEAGRGRWGPGRLGRGRWGPVVIRVVLADDQALVRAGFRALLDAQPDIEVVGEAADGDEAVKLAVRERPEVVLMDIRMPGTDGLAATRRIVGDDRLDGVHVVILTTFDLDEYVFEALRSGASGFLVKDTEPVELIQAVRVVSRGDALLSAGVTRRISPSRRPWSGCCAPLAGQPLGQQQLGDPQVHGRRHLEVLRRRGLDQDLPAGLLDQHRVVGGGGVRRRGVEGLAQGSARKTWGSAPPTARRAGSVAAIVPPSAAARLTVSVTAGRRDHRGGVGVGRAAPPARRSAPASPAAGPRRGRRPARPIAGTGRARADRRHRDSPPATTGRRDGSTGSRRPRRDRRPRLGPAGPATTTGADRSAARNACQRPARAAAGRRAARRPSGRRLRVSHRSRRPQ